jgi:hypothetical protein
MVKFWRRNSLTLIRVMGYVLAFLLFSVAFGIFVPEEGFDFVTGVATTLFFVVAGGLIVLVFNMIFDPYAVFKAVDGLVKRVRRRF